MFTKKILPYTLMIIFALCSCATPSSSLKILGISTLGSESHHIWFTRFMNGLARNGHEIYAIGLWPTKFDVESNRTHSLVFEGVLDAMNDNDMADPLSWINMNPLQLGNFVLDYCNILCELQMATESFKRVIDLVKNSKVDAIVHDATAGHCFYALREIAQGDPALIAFSPFGSPSYINDIAGGHTYPAIKPFAYSSSGPPRNIWQKTLNVFHCELDALRHEYLYMPAQQKIVEKFLGQRFERSLIEIERSVDVVLVNSYPTLNPEIPLPLNVIEVGGLQIRDPQPLPKDIQKFLDEAKHGAVVVSLGTNLQSHNLKPEKLHAIVSAFAQLKQRVLWKFGTAEFPLPNKPDNVMIKSWLPQSDILAHPNVKLLWSHAGLLSTQEAIWRGIPIVGMPFYMDQIHNMDLVVSKGVGLRLDYETLTTDAILDTLNQILTNPSFSKNMAQLSWDFRDRPMSPLDLAVWHVEHATRHSRGILSSPVRELNRFQLHNLDVYAFLFCLVFFPFWILRRCLRYIYRLFSSRKNNTTQVKQKQK